MFIQGKKKDKNKNKDKNSVMMTFLVIEVIIKSTKVGKFSNLSVSHASYYIYSVPALKHK